MEGNRDEEYKKITIIANSSGNDNGNDAIGKCFESGFGHVGDR